LEAIRAAQQQACRQGSIFVAPPHLLLGLLDVPDCIASQLLQAAGLSAAAADAALVDPAMLPKSSFMGAGDLHWAPDARVALTAAAEAAQAAGGCRADRQRNLRIYPATVNPAL
jgi:ATP-dependent Clp protease ATP-binding subunit ClpA